MIVMNRPVKARRARADRSPPQLEAVGTTADLVPIGLTRRPHGVAGEVLVQALGETLPSVEEGEPLVVRFPRRSDSKRSLTVRRIRPTHGDLHLLALDEIRTREDARTLCGAELCVPRSRLPALRSGEYYRADLLGLAVVTESGDTIGVVEGFLDLPQHDVLVVRNGSREVLLPMVEDSVHAIELQAGRIVASLFLDEPPGSMAASDPAQSEQRGGRASARAGV